MQSSAACVSFFVKICKMRLCSRVIPVHIPGVIAQWCELWICGCHQAISGQAVDRHLLGLKLVALESGQNIPQLHLDIAFTESTYFRLSTSQVWVDLKLAAGQARVYIA